MIGSEKSTEHRQRETKRYAGHTEKVSGLNELKNLATREKLEVWGYKLYKLYIRRLGYKLGIYQIAIYLWNSGNVAGRFFNSAKNANMPAENLQSITDIHCYHRRRENVYG